MRIVGDRFVLDETTEPKDGVMAEVFRAVDSRHQMRPVAVKLFKEGFLDSRLTLEAFSRETQSLDELNEYPGIARLVDCGTDKATQRKYIALEWVDFNLVDFLKHNPVRDWDMFYRSYGRPILQALCFAYSKGIIHRDVKPQNILVTTEGQIKVCDFGISKFKKYYRPGTTLVSFASPPYAPPERDSGEYADSRDCYGFAVLTLEAISNVDLEADSDVAQLICETAMPPAVINILLRAVSVEPAERPRNVQELFDELESLHLEGSRAAKRLPVYLRVTHGALEALRLELNNAPNARLLKYVTDDVNEAFGFDYWRTANEGAMVESRNELALFGVEFRYRLAVDDTCPGRFAVVWATRLSPARLEVIRDRCWSGDLQFEIGSPPDLEASTQVITFITSGVDEFVAARRLAESKRKESAIFEKWSTLLRLSEDLQRDKEHAIRFDEGVVEDAYRLTLRVSSTPDPELVGQARVVRVDGRNLAAGIVDNVTEQHIRLSTEAPLSEEEIGHGELVVDMRLEKTSIDRQTAALNAVQFDRARRTDLRRLLVSPSIARVPVQKDVEKFFNSDLDGSQKDIVRSALGAEDFLVVEGPPGTGKTKFIAELVLQILSENPNARIVLSSQTHNALDNAIERVRPLAALAAIHVNIIRIALRTDSRVSENVRELILENQVDIWLNQVRKKSQEFLEQWATANGLSKRSIEIGLAIAAFRTARTQVEQQSNQLRDLDKATQALEAEEQQLRSDEKGADKLEAVTARLEQFRRDSIDARGLIAQQRKDLAAARKALEAFGGDGKDLVSFTDEELADWEKNYLESSPGGRRLRQLIEMVDEWYARFGRSKDFFSAFVADANVIAGTCVAVTGRGLQDIQFDYCIVDEASKATPTEILVPIARSKRWIIVGDPHQLSPFKVGLDGSKRRLADYELSKEDLDETLLDLLLHGLPKECKKKLNFQHRMVREIGELVSHCFYDKTLDNSLAAESKISLREALPRPVTWFSTSRMSDRRETAVGTSFKNLAEVRVIRKLLQKIQQAAAKQNVNLAVAMLTGYVPQVLELRRIAASMTSQLGNLSIDCQSVDRYQGREADIAIYSVARSNNEGKIGFLSEVERLNVALSRARIGLAIVGDSHFCTNVHGENPFRQVLDHIRGHRADCSLTEAVA